MAGGLLPKAVCGHPFQPHVQPPKQQHTMSVVVVVAGV